MADERELAQEDQWWAADALPDSPSPEPSFDEPLQWPDVAGFRPEADEPVPSSDAELSLASAPVFPVEDPDDAWPAALDLDALDVHKSAGPTGPTPDDGLDLHLDALPDSLWSADPVVGEEPLPANAPVGPQEEPQEEPQEPPEAPLVVTSALPDPTFYAEPEHPPVRRTLRRPDLRHGNAAVVALISFVSLVLLGMFLSVRARNDMSTDRSPSRPAGDQIAAQGSLNTIPLPTSVATTTTVPPAVALSDLLPPPDASGDASPGTEIGGATSGGGASGGGAAPVRTATPAPTAAPSRSPAPTGGSGGGGSGSGSPTQPAATQPPADPPANQQPATTSPPNTTRPVDTTQRPRLSPTTTVMAPDTDFTVPTVTLPDDVDRPGFPTFPRPDVGD